MSQSKIITIGRESFLLPVSVTEADLLKILQVLAQCEPIDCDANYLPSAETEYGETVNVLKAGRAPEIEIKMTARRVMTKAAFDEALEEGRKAYRAAHPVAT